MCYIWRGLSVQPPCPYYQSASVELSVLWRKAAALLGATIMFHHRAGVRTTHKTRCCTFGYSREGVIDDEMQATTGRCVIPNTFKLVARAVPILLVISTCVASNYTLFMPLATMMIVGAPHRSNVSCSRSMAQPSTRSTTDTRFGGG